MGVEEGQTQGLEGPGEASGVLNGTLRRILKTWRYEREGAKPHPGRADSAE